MEGRTAEETADRSAAERRRELYEEITRGPAPADVTSADVLAALDEVRTELGTAEPTERAF